MSKGSVAISMDWGEMKSFTWECLDSEGEVLVASVVSYSLGPYGLQPSRLLCPWNFLGKNTGLPFPPPGDLPDPGIEHGSPALQADSSLSEPPWEDRFKASSLVNYPHDFWKIFYPLHPSIHPIIHLLSQKLTLRVDITRWSIPKSD